MDLELEGKAAIVTGGSRGIGKAVARELGLEGVDVAIVARGQEALDETAAELSAETGRRIVPIAADTGDDASVRAMVECAAESLGRVDILVNSAARPLGQAPEPSLSEFTDDHFWADMNVKTMGYVRCAREVFPHMAERGWGRIINVSGLGSRNAGSLIGGMRNVAVVAMTKNLAEELGQYGISVTVVHPGYTRTEASPRTIARNAEVQGVSEEEIVSGMKAANPLGRIIDAREVAYVVAFLASPKSVAVNGDIITAGGGQGKSIYY
jgi:NAD(P)-dependent dehydrogenase (short-subunit alcohol dehydrogenase family)